MKEKTTLKILLLCLLFASNSVQAKYWLVIGTYRQAPISRPQVSGLTSRSLHIIPMEKLDSCKKGGKKITNEIYKSVWQIDSKWTCILSGSN